MHVLKVGEPYIPGRTSWPEAVEYNCRSGAHELRLFLARLTQADVTAIRSGPAEFALATHGPVIFLLYRFGDAIPWSDAPFTIHLLPQDERTPPPDLAPQLGALLQIVLVSAETGRVAALRAVSLAPRFSRQLHAAIRLQASRPFDPQAYDQALAALYQRYPTTNDLLATATARTHGGD